MDEGMTQRLTLDSRAQLAVSGVEEVERFDENAVVLKTVCGMLIVRGSGLHLRQLSVDGGQVAVDGRVDALTFEELRQGSFWERLFG